MTNSDPLERDIEERVCQHAKAHGCLVYKFTSPARRSVPDRIFFLPFSAGCFMIEFKRLGKKPTPGQAVEIAKLKMHGVQVFVCDSVADGRMVVDSMMKKMNDDMF